MSYKYETLTKLDQHVNEMIVIAGKTFQNFRWSRFLIIVQNVNMVVNGKRNRRLNPGTLSHARRILQSHHIGSFSLKSSRFVSNHLFVPGFCLYCS